MAWTSGQLKMALASELHKHGANARIAFDAAMEIVDFGKVPSMWREKLGDKIADAIDADLTDLTR